MSASATFPASTGSGGVLECGGDPRAMGRAQGRACRSRVREALPEGRRRSPLSLRRLASGGVLESRAGLELIRHYTHLAERMDGLARGAGVSFDSVMRACLGNGSAREDEPAPLSQSAESVGRCDSGAAWLVRTLPSGAPWLVRRSVPEVGFASLEVTLPWLAHGVAGVNEHGVVAMLCASLRSPDAQQAPGALLVQECLQRFREVDGCLDWCRKRPSAAGATLLLGDARGAGLVRVETGPRVVASWPAEGVQAESASHERSARLRERARESPVPSKLDALLPEGRVQLEARERSLRLETAEASISVSL